MSLFTGRIIPHDEIERDYQEALWKINTEFLMWLDEEMHCIDGSGMKFQFEVGLEGPGGSMTTRLLYRGTPEALEVEATGAVEAIKKIMPDLEVTFPGDGGFLEVVSLRCFKATE